MNCPSSGNRWRELDQLVGRVLEGLHDEEDASRLNSILLADADARRRYVNCITLHGRLAWDRGSRADEPFSELDNVSRPDDIAPPSFAPVADGATGIFSDWVASYVIAAAICGIGLLLSCFVYMSPVETTNDQFTLNGGGCQAAEYVGRITGLVDCQWNDPNGGSYFIGSSIPLGRRYDLASGLMEITYASGAKVILEGPCTYKVDSSAGGFLAIGKLTARVETKGSGVGGQGSEVRGRKSHPSSLFSVRTPTAIVTDLGTEFGVEVDENGDTVSYVFQGSIKVQGLAASAASGAAREEKVLHANESIRVSRVRKTHQDSSSAGATGSASDTQVRFTHPTNPPKFVRQLHEPPKHIDLLDIVAGGDGLGLRREKGIDPTTGMQDPAYPLELRRCECRYQPVEWNRFVDGVFVPNSRDGAVKVDSAGHIFKECPETQGIAWGSIWARAAKVKHPRVSDDNLQWWIYAINNDQAFQPQGRGLMCICSNAGITFDLQAMRDVADKSPLAAFQATAGMATVSYEDDFNAMAELWVLVDGRVKFQRREVHPGAKPFAIDVPLEANDRFLTIVVTDGERRHYRDWFVLGDPIITLQEDAESHEK